MYVHVLGNDRIFGLQRGFVWMVIVDFDITPRSVIFQLYSSRKTRPMDSSARSGQLSPYVPLLPPGASAFHKHMSSFYLLPSNTTTTCTFCKCTETQNLYSWCCCLSILFVCLFLFIYYYFFFFFGFDIWIFQYALNFIYLFHFFCFWLRIFLGTLDFFPSLQLTKKS